MKVSIHLEGKTKADLHKDALAQAAALFGAPAEAAAPAKKAGKAAKAEKEEEFDLEDEDDEDDADESEDDADDSDDDLDDEDDAGDDDSEEEDDADESDDEEEEEAAPKKKAKASAGPSLQDVIGAFQKYAKKTSREKAGKVLAKFKVKSVKDLKPADFTKAIAALK